MRLVAPDARPQQVLISADSDSGNGPFGKRPDYNAAKVGATGTLHLGHGLHDHSLDVSKIVAATW
ncbi:MAG TPA: hypothetical protein VGN22_04945 [Pseudonocardia sp.]